MRVCGVTYEGPSYPECHGQICVKAAGHDRGSPHGDAKHASATDLRWYTTDQKVARHVEEQMLKLFEREAGLSRSRLPGPARRWTYSDDYMLELFEREAGL